jgi:hypothetical protein
LHAVIAAGTAREVYALGSDLGSDPRVIAK